MAPELEKRAQTEVAQTTSEHIVDPGAAFSPDVDIFVNDDALRLAVDLPGVNKGDAKIEVDENNTLIVRAKNSHTEPTSGALARQFRTGDYYRAFQMSDEFDKERISARMENGLLEITVPRREEVKPRRIQINA